MARNLLHIMIFCMSVIVATGYVLSNFKKQPFFQRVKFYHEYNSMLLHESHTTYITEVSKKWKRLLASIILIPTIMMNMGGDISIVRADDELAKYAAEGNSVGVDGKCFMLKCPIETQQCASDLSCLKGLSCLAR